MRITRPSACHGDKNRANSSGNDEGASSCRRSRSAALDLRSNNCTVPFLGDCRVASPSAPFAREEIAVIAAKMRTVMLNGHLKYQSYLTRAYSSLSLSSLSFSFSFAQRTLQFSIRSRGIISWQLESDIAG